MAGEDEVRWNRETQRWDTGTPRGPFTPPPQPPPEFEQLPASGAVLNPDPHPDPDPDPSPDSVPVSHPRPGSGGHPRLPGKKAVAVLTAAVLVGAGTGIGGWYLTGRDGDGTRRDDGRSKASTAPATDGPSPSESTRTAQGTSPSPSPTGPPPGYRTVSEGEFDIVVPEDWQLRTEPGAENKSVTLYYYEEPGGGRRFVQVFRVSERDATPLSTLRAAEKYLERSPGYRRNSLKEVPDERGVAAELDYSYRSEKWGTQLRILDRVIHADEDVLYTVLVSGPADTWPEQRKVLQTAVDSFCLGSVCPPA
jgi:hypothetical protein